MSEDQHIIEPPIASGEPVSIPDESLSLGRALVATVVAANMVILVSLFVLVLPCWMFLAIIPAAAFPIWRYWCERAMFRRRLIIDALMHEGSWLRGIIHRGYFHQLWLLILAFGVAGVLLAAVRTLQERHWLLLAVDALLLPLLLFMLRWILRSHTRPAALLLISRQWPLSALNVGLLAAGFMLVDFYFGAPDTRGQGLWAAFTGGYAEFSGQAACDAAGVLCGVISGIDRAVWHVRESTIPLLPEVWARYVVWGVSLLQASVLAFAFNALLTGALMLSVKRQKNNAEYLPYRTALRAFMLTIVVLACTVLMIVFIAEQMNQHRLAAAPVQSIPAAIVPPCPEPDNLTGPLQADLQAALQKTTAAVEAATEQMIRQQLRGTFQRAEVGVDKYLDWYYTVTGEYQRLVAMAVGDPSQQLSQRLLEDAFGGRLEAELGKTAQAAALEAEVMFVKFAKDAGVGLQAKISANRCLSLAMKNVNLTSLEHDVQRAGSAAAIGATTTGVVTTKALAAKVGNTVAAKVAAKKFAKVAAAAAAKAAAKKGTGAILAASAGTVACAPTGPVAFFCGIGAGIVTWFGMDKIFIEADELMNRAEAKQEIVGILTELENELATEMITLQRSLIAAHSTAAKTEVGKLFVPVRDGV